ncbi:MAG: potassium channel family protein [Akkermansia sp.]|nr:potassium channel family protein [Akkermansia sp.]
MQRSIREKIFEVVEVRECGGVLSRVYNQFMLLLVVVSLLPLAFKENYAVFAVTDRVVVVFFVLDYLLNWLTEDLRSGRRSIRAFLRYPFTLQAIVDLLSILPAVSFVHDGFRLLRLSRGLRLLRLAAVFKLAHHSQNMLLVLRTMRDSRDSLLAVCYLAVGYILLSALVIFNVEPQTYPSFFDALYWATVSLTTVGYGDIYPVTMLGRCVTMLSSLLGIALIALPAGIITAGYMNALHELKQKRR